MSNSCITNNTSSNHNHNHNHHHHSSSRISNGTQACAACKYQRRKCASDCALAPYFPHDRQRQFLNAHKLFGVSNITKIIRNLSPPDKDIAMRTIIYQSDARAKDPVGGCYRIIRELQYQIAYFKAELDVVIQQLELCKAQVYHQQQQQQLYPGNNNNNNNEQQYMNMMLPISSCSEQNNGQLDQNDQYSWVAPANEEAVLASSNSSTSHGECFVIKSEFVGECEGLEMKPQIQIGASNGGSYDIDEEREYGSKFDDDSSTHVDLSCCDLQGDELKFVPQQTTQLSEEEVVALKGEKIVVDNPEEESFHHISEHDLRNAATMFTLTN
ncbi:LOB domain-containing protein 22 [Beta vulgaris subsp. vulgaris]|uniref:LOB domain-containing protein 22 n=1 Tax=Beta vulgaris subsp. vulgaris TaxID=3555 RepID=UPI002548BEB0|nr:LOB domain-containing protein 22 [Beta vulgaris subsp. vulgaris]